MVKRTLSLVLTVLMLCAVLSFGAYAENRGPFRCIAVNVSLDENPGIDYLKIRVSYEKSKLDLIEVTDKEILKGFQFVSGKSLSDDPYHVLWAASEDNNSTGELLRLAFEVKAPSAGNNYDISVEVDSAFNQEMESVEVKLSSKIFASYDIGDVDGNGKVFANDARLALRASARLEELSREAFYAADCDRNGVITAGEARMILRYSANLPLN
ncbi:MAG: hypothetical protein K6G90_07165 [Clostridia bacterium]|nr:hypothetical protein [Clostridia bacterium]